MFRGTTLEQILEIILDIRFCIGAHVKEVKGNFLLSLNAFQWSSERQSNRLNIKYGGKSTSEQT